MKQTSTTWRKLCLTVVLLFAGFPLLAQRDIGKAHLVYQVKEMESIKPMTVIYRDTLKADIYEPVGASERRPCVIFISGFASINFREMQAYVDWARLVAVHGMIGVVYETNSPAFDFDKLNEYLIANASTLHIDTNNIGIWSCSGNSPLGVYKVNASDRFKCHSIYYGLATTFGSRYLDEVKEMSKRMGFAVFVEREYTARTPTLIIRAGKDHLETIQKCLDEFINELLKKNIPLELVNYPEGQHAFDLLDDNDTSREIIVRTINFFEREFSK
jgi:hypothetical protein